MTFQSEKILLNFILIINHVTLLHKINLSPYISVANEHKELPFFTCESDRD